MSYKSWIFTVNNYTPEDIAILESWKTPSMCHRLTAGRELAPTTGTPHLQCAVTFVRAYRLCKNKAKGVQGLLPRANWRPMMVRGERPWEYSLEDGDVLIDYTCKKQGHRSDNDKVYDSIEAGESRADFLDTRPTEHMIRFWTTLRFMMFKAPEWRDLVVINLYGPTGSWKSRHARAQQERWGEAWVSPLNSYGGIDWDSYDLEKFIILEEFRPKTATLPELLRILDGYPLEVHARYCNRKANWRFVIITSPDPIINMFQGVNEDLAQLKRRIKHTVTVEEAKKLPGFLPVVLPSETPPSPSPSPAPLWEGVVVDMPSGHATPAVSEIVIDSASVGSERQILINTDMSRLRTSDASRLTFCDRSDSGNTNGPACQPIGDLSFEVVTGTGLGGAGAPPPPVRVLNTLELDGWF